MHYARKRTSFHLVEESFVRPHCVISGRDNEGKSKEFKVMFDPPPHPWFHIRIRTHTDIFRFAHSLGMTLVEKIDIVGKYQTATYVEGDPRPVQVIEFSKTKQR